MDLDRVYEADYGEEELTEIIDSKYNYKNINSKILEIEKCKPYNSLKIQQ